MPSRTFCAFLVLGLVLSAGSSSGCRWMEDKFSQYSESSLMLLDAMETAEDAGTDGGVLIAFPDNLYLQTSRASAEDRLAFTAQVLKEVCNLFEEDHSAASWEDSALENFLNVLHKQAEELSSCTETEGNTKRAKRLHMYFRRLSHHVLHSKGHSAVAWELIRKEVRLHLMRVHLLASSAP